MSSSSQPLPNGYHRGNPLKPTADIHSTVELLETTWAVITKKFDEIHETLNAFESNLNTTEDNLKIIEGKIKTLEESPNLGSETKNYLETVMTSDVPPSSTNPVAESFAWPSNPFPRIAADAFEALLAKHRLPPIIPSEASSSYPFCDPQIEGEQRLQETSETFTESVFQEIDTKQTFDLLIQVFKNIPENGDRKTVKAINTLKKMINKSPYIELIALDNPTLKSILKLRYISKKPLFYRVYKKLSGEKINGTRIQSISNIQFIVKILNLLSSNESVSSESREIFSLLHNVFNRSIVEVKETLQSIITAQDISKEVEDYRRKEASAALFSLDRSVVAPKRKRSNSSATEKSKRREKKRKEDGDLLLEKARKRSPSKRKRKEIE
ncbi:MAG: hypothetical protein KR126chlam4_01080 [Candidatus Anoxychlamydiales bacterium]|nr:hypothetical protein [Candidatus Anoxychlamydiales bacterium]